MTWHLMRDVLGRTSSLALTPLFSSYFIWLISDRAELSLRTTFAMTMVIAFVAQLGLAGALASRELLLLPASGRDIWRARWALMMLVAGGGGALGKALAFATGFRPGEPGLTGWDTVLLSWLYDVGYAGTFLAWTSTFGIVSYRMRQLLGRRGGAAFGVIAMLVLVFGFVWPLVLRGGIVTNTSDLIGIRGAALAAMVALTLISVTWRFVPRPTATVDRRPEWTVAAARPAVFRPQVAVAGPTGLRMLVWTDWIWTARLTLVTVTLFAVGVGSLLQFTDPGVPLLDRLRGMGLLPFDSAARGSDRFIGLMLLGFVCVGSRSFSDTDWLLSMARHFRALPLGMRRYLAVLFGVPLLGWVTLWALFVVLHIAATQTLPLTLRLEWFVLFGGVDACVRAAQLRYRRDRMHWTFLALVPLFIGMIAAIETGYPGLVVHPVSVVIAGLTYFAVAAAVFYGTLTRSRVPYAMATKSPSAA